MPKYLFLGAGGGPETASSFPADGPVGAPRTCGGAWPSSSTSASCSRAKASSSTRKRLPRRARLNPAAGRPRAPRQSPPTARCPRPAICRTGRRSTSNRQQHMRSSFQARCSCRARPGAGAVVRVDRRPGGHVRDAPRPGLTRRDRRADAPAQGGPSTCPRCAGSRKTSCLKCSPAWSGAAATRCRRGNGCSRTMLLEALRVWPEHPPRDPRAWLARSARPGGLVQQRPAQRGPPGHAARKTDLHTSRRRPLRV